MANYFDNNKAEELFLRYRDEGCLKSRDELMLMTHPLIVAVINSNRFYRFENIDLLTQVANETILKKLLEYDPDFITVRGTKVLIFNYLSLLTKNSVFWYTKEQQKHRKDVGFDLLSNTTIRADEDDDSEDVIDNIVRACIKLANSNNFNNIFKILGKYLKRIKEFNKKEYATFVKSYGYSDTLVRKSLKILNQVYVDNRFN